MLDDWSGFDLDRATKYIVDSQRYDGGIAMGPGQEGHGGSTFVAVASLFLMKRLSQLRDRKGLLRWCIRNQGSHGSSCIVNLHFLVMQVQVILVAPINPRTPAILFGLAPRSRCLEVPFALFCPLFS